MQPVTRFEGQVAQFEREGTTRIVWVLSRHLMAISESPQIRHSSRFGIKMGANRHRTDQCVMNYHSGDRRVSVRAPRTVPRRARTLTVPGKTDISCINVYGRGALKARKTLRVGIQVNNVVKKLDHQAESSMTNSLPVWI
jgi:hypothetical protein